MKITIDYSDIVDIVYSVSEASGYLSASNSEVANQISDRLKIVLKNLLNQVISQESHVFNS